MIDWDVISCDSLIFSHTLNNNDLLRSHSMPTRHIYEVNSHYGPKIIRHSGIITNKDTKMDKETQNNSDLLHSSQSTGDLIKDTKKTNENANNILSSENQNRVSTPKLRSAVPQLSNINRRRSLTNKQQTQSNNNNNNSLSPTISMSWQEIAKDTLHVTAGVAKITANKAKITANKAKTMIQQSNWQGVITETARPYVEKAKQHSFDE